MCLDHSGLEAWNEIEFIIRCSDGKGGAKRSHCIPLFLYKISIAETSIMFIILHGTSTFAPESNVNKGSSSVSEIKITTVAQDSGTLGPIDKYLYCATDSN